MKYYKVWGGGFVFPKYKAEDEKSDWSGYYFQHNVKHSLSYTTKKYDDGYELVSLVRMVLLNQKIRVVRLQDKYYGDGKIPGAAKAVRAKQELTSILGLSFGDNQQRKLMEVLGNHLILLEILDSDEFELIIPHRLFTPENFLVEVIGEFKRHPTSTHLTSGHKRPNSEEWTACNTNQRYQPHLLAPYYEQN